MCLSCSNFTVCPLPGSWNFHFSMSGCICQESSKSHCHCLSTKYLHFHLPFAKLPAQVLRPKFQPVSILSAFSAGSGSITTYKHVQVLSQPVSSPFPLRSASFNVSHLKMHATVYCPQSRVHFNGRSTIKCYVHSAGRTFN